MVLFLFIYIYKNAFTDIEKYMYFGQQNFAQSEENRRMMLFFSLPSSFSFSTSSPSLCLSLQFCPF